MIIADTCLIIHLFNVTDLTKTAQRVLEKDPHWILAPLWQEEYANVLSKLARRENRDTEEVLDHFQDVVNQLKNCEVVVDNKRALEVSLDYKISVYDAHFITLAMEMDTLLITEDKEILKKCSDFAMSMSAFLKN